MPGQEERMRVIHIPRTEMETITAKLGLRRTFLTNLPAHSHVNLEVRQKVLVYRKEAKHSKWTGQYRIT